MQCEQRHTTKSKRLFFLIFLLIFWLISPLAIANKVGKLAIIIDDMGYSAREDSAILRLPQAVNVSIIPVAPYAKVRAEQAFAQQRDILIHLPMQPKNPQQAVEKGALKVGDGYEKSVQQLEKARQNVPYAIGLNNHMGSGATADAATMQHFMKALAEQQLFFLDSKTGNSVAAKIARSTGIKTLERHLFLDDSNELKDVKRQFDTAIGYARKQGLAILIGHPRKNSIKVLEEGLKHLPADIQLVKISTLWREEKMEPNKPFIVLFDIEPAPTSLAPFGESYPLLRGIPRE